jgi:hypothetical protein
MPINRQLPHTVGGSIRITGRAAQDFAPRPCVCSNKPVWHYVKSGRPGALHIRQGQHKGLRIK